MATDWSYNMKIGTLQVQGFILKVNSMCMGRECLTGSLEPWGDRSSDSSHNASRRERTQALDTLSMIYP